MSWFSRLFESEKETPKVSAEALVPKAQAYIEAARALAESCSSRRNIITADICFRASETHREESRG